MGLHYKGKLPYLALLTNIGHIVTNYCKAFCEFLLRAVFDKDYLRLPYNKQKGMEPKFCTVSLLLENCSKKYDPKGFSVTLCKKYRERNGECSGEQS